jgi:hypothetical protein
VVEAGSFSNASTGRYRLMVSAVDTPPPTVPDPARVRLVEVGEIRPGASMESARFAVQGVAGELVIITVDVIDGDLDPVVELLGPDGDQVGRDDDGGEGRNSRLQVRFPSTGTHVAVVTPFRHDQAGRYRITVLSGHRTGMLE